MSDAGDIELLDAHVARLLPPDAIAAWKRQRARLVRRPAGGSVLGAVPLAKGGIVEEQRASGAGDPRAEREERPRRRSSQQVQAVVGAGFPATDALRRHNDEREREE